MLLSVVAIVIIIACPSDVAIDIDTDRVMVIGTFIKVLSLFLLLCVMFIVIVTATVLC